MKNLFMVAATLMSCLAVNAQINADKNGAASSDMLIKTANPGANNHGMAFYHTNPPREVDGTIHLFDTWNNDAIIHTNDNQRFLVKNVNLNIERNSFEAKVEGDSVFAFNFNNVKQTVINGKIYKNYFWEDDNRVYEVIHDDGTTQLLKGFKVNFVEGSANPMLNRSFDRYVKKEYYFIRKDDKIKKFKLSKKNVLKLVDGDNVKADEIVDYAKNNKLSFSSENDIKKILEYSAKN